MSSTRITAADVPTDLAGIDLLIDVRSAKGRAEQHLYWHCQVCHLQDGRLC